MRRKRVVIGIDEVGRGALCGPVTVGAFVFLGRERFLSRIDRAPLRDSKRLTSMAREEWYRTLKRHAHEGRVAFRTARVTSALVDRMNISNAANLAATRAYERLVVAVGCAPASVTVLLDGGLFIHPRMRFEPRSTRTIVRGDEKIPEIQLASIVAKVTRDRGMTRLHARHPRYGLGAHKGYGTKAHRAALMKHGPVRGLHRSTFCRFLPST